MEKLKNNQRGVSVPIVILGILVVCLIGLAAWFVVSQNRPSSNVSQTPSDSSDESEGSGDATSPLAKYQSVKGGFTMYYPKAWQVSGFINGQKSTSLTGEEDRLLFQSVAEGAKIDNFGASLTISGTQPADTPWPTYPNGSIVERFNNGIDAWEDNQKQTWQDGQKTNTCPRLRIASNNAFGLQLKNGKWLMLEGSFCWQAGQSTTYSYNQQRDSTQFADTLRMLESITQN